MVRTPDQFLEELEATNLPTLPHVLLKLLEACNSDDSSFKALAEVINKDTALSSKILGAANSALYNRPHKITVFEENLALLGLDTIRAIAVSSSVYQVFSNFADSSECTLKRFWHHSLSCATLAKLIAQKTSYSFPDEAYLTGLLLDVGKLVLWNNFPKQYEPLLASPMEETQLTLLETERFGATHCQVGSWLIASWNLSSFMSDAVLYHHEPLERIRDAHQLIRIVYLAHVLGSEAFSDAHRHAVADSLLGISAQEAQGMMEKAGEQVKSIAQYLEIDIGTNNSDEQAAQEPSSAIPVKERSKRGADEIPPVPDAITAGSGIDSPKRLQLAREVRDIALLDGALQHFSGPATQESALLSVRRSFYILFGLQNVMFFLCDQEKNMVYGKSMSGQSELIDELVIPLAEGKSMLADSLLTRTARDSFSCRKAGRLALIDEQIIRLSQKEGIYCIPMASRQSSAGVAIFGISESHLPWLEKKGKLIASFAQQAALSLLVSRMRDEQTRLAAFETMAASRAKARQIVHEANNPLSIMKNYIKVLGMKLNKADPAQEDLAILNEEIARVARIIRQFSDTMESAASLSEPLNINGAILDLIKIMQESLLSPHKVAVQTDLDPSLPDVVTDKNKFKQVMINLMKNAAEAMPDGGALSVSTRSNVVQDGANYIEITVRDNGPGIPPEIMANLFEPTSSTKGNGHAGLGLTIVKNIVGELKGKIGCRSDPQSGTTFTILIPATPAAEQ